VKKRATNRASIPSESSSEVVLPSRLQQLLDGYLDVKDLDMDELRLGKIRNNDGSLPKGPAARLPPGLTSRIAREYRTQLQAEFDKYGKDAIDTITDVMYRGEGASAFQGQKDGVKRLEAAKYVIERIIGPIPSKSEVTTNVTVWEGMQETGGLFVDVDVTDIEEKKNVPPREPAPRTRGPRTRPRRQME
jgi:hypothetical protein